MGQVGHTSSYILIPRQCHKDLVDFKGALLHTVFEDTQVNVTSEGRPHLGAAIGTESYINSYVKQKVEQWSVELERLATVATAQPHSAFAAFTFGFTSKWTHLGHSKHQPLLTAPRRHNLHPSHTCSEWQKGSQRNLLSLPARLGGIGLTEVSTSEFAASQDIPQPLSDLIAHQISSYPRIHSIAVLPR